MGKTDKSMKFVASFELDYKKMISDMNKSLDSLDGLGLSDAASKEVQEVKASVDKMAKEIKNSLKGLAKDMHGVLNAGDSSDFLKAQETILKRVDLLEGRTDALEKSLVTLAQAMNKPDASKLIDQTNQLANGMQTIIDVSKNVPAALDQALGATTKKGLEDLIGEIKQAQIEIEKTFILDKPVQNAKVGFLRLQAQMKEYAKLLEKVNTLKEKQNRTAEEDKELASLVGQLVRKNKELKEIAESSQALDTSFFTVKIDENRTIGKFVQDLQTDLTKTESFIESWVERINTVLNETGSNIQIKSPDNYDLEVKKDGKGNGKGLSVPLNIRSTPYQITQNAIKIIQDVNNRLEDTPVEVDLVFTQKWGTQQNRKLLKNFQAQIDNLAKDTDIEELQKLRDSIAESWGDQISIKFKSNWEDEEEVIRNGLAIIRNDLGKLKANPKVTLKDTDVEKLQKQLDTISKKLTLNINKISLSEESSTKVKESSKAKTKEAKEVAQALDSVLDAINSKTSTLDGNFKNAKVALEAIRKILESFPLDGMVRQVSNLVATLREAFELGELKDAEGLFEEIKNDIAEINGPLSGKDNKFKVDALKEALGKYKEYLKLGGARGVEELSGEGNVQRWLKNNVKKIEQAAETTGNAYAEGIEKTTPKASKSGQKLAKAVEEAVATTQDSNSPSKVAIMLGKYWGDGYADGILESAPKMKEAIRALVKEAKVTVKELTEVSPTEGLVHEMSQDVWAEIVNNKSWASKLYKANRQRIKDLDYLFSSENGDSLLDKEISWQSNEAIKEQADISKEIWADIEAHERKFAEATKEATAATKEQTKAVKEEQAAEAKSNATKEASSQKTRKKKQESKETTDALTKQGAALSNLASAEEKASKATEEAIDKTKKQKNAAKETADAVDGKSLLSKLGFGTVADEAADAGQAVEGATSVIEEESLTWEKVSKRAQELADSLNAVGKALGATTSPFNGAGVKGLEKIYNDFDRKIIDDDSQLDEYEKKERQKALARQEKAKKILKAHENYTKTGDPTYLSSMLQMVSEYDFNPKYVKDADAIKNKMVIAVNKRLDEISESLNAGAEEAVEEAASSQKEKQYKWGNKKEYDAWLKANKVITSKDPQIYKYNYENRLKQMEKNGRIRGKGRDREYQIPLSDEEIAELEKANQKTEELAKSAEEVEAGFQKIKNKFKELGDIGADAKSTKALMTWTEQFFKYQQAGGTRSIEELTDNKEALGKIKDTYAKLTKEQEKNTESKKSTAKVSKEVADATKKEAEAEKTVQKETKNTAKAKTDSKKSSTKADKEATQSAKERASAEKEVQKETQKTSQAKKEASKSSKSDASASKQKVKQAQEEAKAEEKVASKKKETAKASKEAAHEEQKAASQKKSSSKETKQATETETEAFKELENPIDAVTQAIKAKTEAIKEERKVVNSAVNQEKKKFKELQDAIDGVTGSVNAKNKSEKNATNSRTRKSSSKSNGKDPGTTGWTSSFGSNQNVYTYDLELVKEHAERVNNSIADELKRLESLGLEPKVKRVSDENGNLTSAVISYYEEIADDIGRVAKASRSFKLNFDENGTPIWKSVEDTVDYTYNEKYQQGVQKTRMAVDKATLAEEKRVDAERVKNHNETAKIERALLDAEVKADNDRVKNHNETFKIEKALHDAEVKADNERVKNYNETYKIEKALLDAEVKADNEKVKNYNETYKTQKALHDAEVKADNEKVKVANETYKINQALLKEEERKDAEKVKVANETYKINQALAKSERQTKLLTLKKQNEQTLLNQLKKNTFDPETINELNQLTKTLDSVKDNSDWADYKELFKQFDLNLKERQRVANIEMESARETAKIREKSYDETLTIQAQNRKKTEDRISSLNDDVSKLVASKYMPELRREIETLQSELKSNPIDPVSPDAIDRIIKAENALSEIKNKTGDKSWQAAGDGSIQGLYTKVENFMVTNTAMASNFKAELQSIIDRIKTGIPISTEELNQLDATFKRISGDVRALGQTGNSVFTSIRKQLQSANAQFIATYFSIHDFIRYIREAAQAVIELDTALTELRKVSDASTERLAESFENSAKTAQKLGSTISHVINVTADWARLGYDVDAAEELARVTTLFTTVGDNMSADDASSYLISTLQGYQLAADDAERIVDRYNEVANNFAIDTRGIGEALQRSAASFYAANTDLSKSIALVTTANSVVQNPESVGTLWKTMSARIRGAKTELEELGEEEDEFTKTTSKLRDLVKGLTGFDIMEDEETFKDIYDIIVGIGKEWNNLSDIEQASLGEALAGKRNINALFATLNNLDMLERAYATAEDSAGSAAKEQENYAKSIQYSIDRVKASVEELAYDFMKSDFLKGTIERFNSFVQIVDKAIESIGVLGTVLIGLGGIGIVKNFKQITDSIKSFSAIGSVIDNVNDVLRTASEGEDAIKGLALATQNISKADTVAALATRGLNKELIKQVLEEQGVEAETIRLLLEEKGLAGTNVTLSGTFKGLAASITGAKIAMGAVIAVIAAVAIAAWETKKANDALHKSAQEMGEAFGSSKKDISAYKDEVAALNEKLKDDNISYEESKAARERLLEIQDDLIAKYGTEAEAIGLITDAINGEVDAFDRLTEKEWQKTKNKFNNQNLEGWDWMNRQMHGAEDNIGVMLADLEKASKSFRLDTSNYDFAKEIAQMFGGTMSMDDRGHMYLNFEGNLDDIYDKLLEIQILSESRGIKIAGLSDAIEDTDTLLNQYREFYDQYNLYERIFPNEEYNRAYTEIVELGNAYKKAFAEGDEAAQKAAKQGVVQVIEELSEGMGDISPDEQAVINTLSDLGVFAQEEISKWNLKADIDFGANNAHKPIFRLQQDILKTQMVDLISSFGSEQALLHKQFAQGSNLEQNYNKLDAYARSHNATVEQLVETYKELGLLKDEFFISPDLQNSVSKLIEGQTVDSRIEGTKQLNAKIKELDEEEQQIWLRFAEDYTGSWWDFLEAFEKEVERVKGRVKEEEVKEKELTAKEALEDYKFEDPTGRKDEISGDEYLNNYFSKVKSLQEAIYKLNSGEATREELAQLKVEYSLVGESAAEMANELNQAIRTEANETVKFIDKVIEKYPYLIDFFEGEKQLIQEAADEARGLESALTGGAKAINDVQNLKAGFDMLGSIYEDVKDKEDFDWSSIINNAEFEAAFKSCGDAYEEFLRVIEKSPDDIKATQQAFDNLATSFYYSNIGSFANATEEEINAITKMLKQMGVVNAQAVVDAQVGLEQAGKTAEEIFANLKVDDITEGLEAAEESLKREYQKIEDWGLGRNGGHDFGPNAGYTDSIINRTIQSKYGNVDMDKRAIIKYNEETLASFKDALQSWEEYDEETGKVIGNYYDAIAEAVRNGESMIDTVHGTQDVFTIGDNEIDIAFTPILVDENGQNPEFLSQGTVKNYIQKVLDMANEEVRNSGEEWSQGAVIKKAFEIDLKGIETDKINAQGEKVGTEFVHGVIAAIGSNAIDVSKLLHMSGDFGGPALEQETLEAYNSLKEKIAEGSLTVANATAAEIEILKQEGIVTAETAQSIALLKMQQILVNENPLDETDGINELIRLAGVAGVATDALIELAKIQSQIDAANTELIAAIESGSVARIDAAKNAIQMLEAKADATKAQLQEDIQNATTLSYEGASDKGKKAAGGAGKDAGDAYVDAFEKELEKLKNAYERGDISLKDYLAQWKALIQKFFADNPKYAEEYANQMKSYLDAVKGYYSGAISGVTTILQGRISALQRQKDKAIKQLEKEKEAALEAYDVQIKAIEKTIKAKQKQIKQLEKEKKAIEAKKKPLEQEIEAIQKANEERDRQLQLQKDLYELERLQNQRTQFVLKDGQMVYQADATAARDQREQVKKDEDEQKIAELEKQIELYDKQIEAIDAKIESINEEIELLEEEKEAIQEQRDEIEAYYDKLIKETEEMFDEMIEGLEEVLEKWQQLAEIETIANAWKQGGEVFEAMGLTIEDVLNDAPGAFEKFRDAWIQVLMDSENGNQHYAEGIKEWGRQNEQTIDGVVNSYKKLGTEGSAGVDPLLTPLDEATTKTQGLGDAASTSAGNVGTLATNTGTLANNAGTLAEKAGDAEENLNGLGANVDFTDLTNKLDALKLLIEDVAKAIYGGEENSIKTAIDNLNTLANLEGIIAQFELLAQAVSAVSSALGGGGEVDTSAAGHVGNTNAQVTAMAGAEGAAGSLADAISQLNAIKLDGDDGIIGQFEQLKQAVDAVTSAISGGGGGEGDMSGVGHIGNTNAQVTAMQGSGEGGDTLISAIEAAKTAAIDNIGMAEEEGETAVGSFMALEGAVTAGTDAIGAEGKSPSLIDGIYKTKEATEENIPPVIALFENLSGVLSACASSINKVVGAIERLTSGGFGGVKLPFFTYSGTAQSGKASLKGDWGFEGGETLIGELGPEIAVLPNGTYKVFDKPQLTRLPKDTVIFNHLQSEEILKRKNQISRFGKSNADGSNNGLLPLQGAALNDMLNLAKAIGADTDVMKMDIGDIKRHAEEISRTVQNVANNNSTSTNVTFGDLNFTCNGISTPEVLSEVQNALNQTFEGMALNAYQHAMAR